MSRKRTENKTDGDQGSSAVPRSDPAKSYVLAIHATYDSTEKNIIAIGAAVVSPATYSTNPAYSCLEDTFLYGIYNKRFHDVESGDFWKDEPIRKALVDKYRVPDRLANVTRDVLETMMINEFVAFITKWQDRCNDVEEPDLVIVMDDPAKLGADLNELIAKRLAPGTKSLQRDFVTGIYQRICDLGSGIQTVFAGTTTERALHDEVLAYEFDLSEFLKCRPGLPEFDDYTYDPILHHVSDNLATEIAYAWILIRYAANHVFGAPPKGQCVLLADGTNPNSKNRKRSRRRRRDEDEDKDEDDE